MQFPTNRKKPPAVKAELFAICLLLACSLQIMENLLPRIPIFPWLRLGLAYWIILPFLIRFGALQALYLFLFRNLITLIYGGQIFSSFLISTSAGFISIILLGTLGRSLFIGKKIGLIGFSTLLACSFNVMQLIIVDKLLIRHQEFYFQLAPILVWSVVSGSLIALLIYKSEAVLDRLFLSEFTLQQNATSQKTKKKLMQHAMLPLSLIVFGSLFVFQDLWLQVACLAVLSLITRLQNVRILLYAWPFYFYIAWLHLFRTDGIYILGEWITREGLDGFLYYGLRTTNIVLCGQWLAKYVPAVLEKIRFNTYLQGASYALPLLPALFGLSMSLGKELFHKAKKREFENLLDPVIDRLLLEFRSIINSRVDASRTSQFGD